jgi:hypothetical protein
MFKIKLTFIVLVLASAVCAVAASSASAGWSIEGVELPAGSKAALATTAKVTENFKLAAAGVTIECTGANLNSISPEIVGPSKIAASSLTFSECKANTNCTVTKTIGTVPVLAELTEQTAPEDKAVFAAETKTTIATIKYEGELCALEGIQPITGKASISLPRGQEGKTLQEIRANTTSGELKLGSNAATLKGVAELRLASGKEFAGPSVILLKAIGGTPGVNPITGKFELKFNAAGETVQLEVINLAAEFMLEEKEIVPTQNNFKFVVPTKKPECKFPQKLKPGKANACFIGIKVQNVGGDETFKLEFDGKDKYEVTLKE